LRVRGGEPAIAGQLQLLGLAAQQPLARSASRPGLRSPAISASIIARPDSPSSLLATESILIPASSSVLDSRCPSAVRCSMSFLR